MSEADLNANRIAVHCIARLATCKENKAKMVTGGVLEPLIKVPLAAPTLSLSAPCDRAHAT